MVSRCRFLYINQKFFYISSSTGFSPRERAGLQVLDAKKILPLGQAVMVFNLAKTFKLQERGYKGFALHPSPESYDYLIYNPNDKIIVDTSYFSIIKSSTNSKTIDEPNVFDSLLDNFINDIEKGNCVVGHIDPIDQVSSQISHPSTSISSTLSFSNKENSSLGGTEKINFNDSTTSDFEESFDEDYVPNSVSSTDDELEYNETIPDENDENDDDIKTLQLSFQNKSTPQVQSVVSQKSPNE